ncbi:mitochondrial 37S ribosomal protein MRP4 [Rhizophagus clarus]|uniref:Mitochondrial 37S ribosomal protein MRP4 n=1 Tax=Rhizophagus clarus TaxID=94130 RepID=A0A8H3L128_9GLOM|nr:mitochondrial 37S ribosomal protein MRP4 [Rhizophagus clarus]
MYPIRNNSRIFLSRQVLYHNRYGKFTTRFISLYKESPLNSSKHQVIDHDYDDFNQELSYRFFKAFKDDKPIDSAKLKSKDDVAEFVKQTGSFKKVSISATKNLKSPPSSYDLTMSSLLSANLHLGHSTSLWNPKTSPFIFGIRYGINIINLDYTLIYLRRACKVVKEISYNDGIILFINTRGGLFSKSVINAAKRCNQYQLTTRWLPGTITNSQQTLGHLIPKNENDIISKTFKPDLLVLLNPLENEIALEEARYGNIPTIGIVDTDFDPNKVTWPIPANDDSVRGVELLVGILSLAAKDDKRMKISTKESNSNFLITDVIEIVNITIVIGNSDHA